MLNISKLFCISPLDFTSTSSSVFLSPLLECVWRVFKRLQGSAKLDRVRCNEKHARESYDIKCHTNTPRQTLQSSSHSICLPSSHACNPSCRWENKENGEPFGGWEKLIFRIQWEELAADWGCTHKYLVVKLTKRIQDEALIQIRFSIKPSCCWWNKPGKIWVSYGLFGDTRKR